MLRTVKVPEQFKPIFEKAQGYVDIFFKGKKENPSKGTIEIFGERYILVRAASLSIDFFETVTRMYAKEGKEEALNFARQILFDVAHAIGMHDARNFHKKMDLKDPIEKLSAGPIHFAHSGWAFVDIFPESVLSPDEHYYLIYDHPYSFESDAWLRAGKKSDFPVCIMNAGYSSGWCEESFGISLVASEIMCRAKGDHACRFIMAPPSRMEAHIESYMQQEPELSGRMKNYEVPGFFRRREAEFELRASEEKCRAIFDNAMVGIVLVDVKDKKFVDVNRTICKMLGYRLDEMREMGVLDIFPEEDRPHVAEEFENLTRDKLAPVEDLPVKRKDGTVFYAVVNFSSVTLSGKRYLVGLFGDITKRRQAELLIERLNHQNELILNAAGEGIFGLDIHGNHTFVNPAAARMLGYTVDELTGMHSHTTVHNMKSDGSPYPEDECPIYAAYKDGKVHRIDDDIFWRKDGTSFPVEYTSTPIIEHGRNVGAVVSFRDITERRKSEKARQASEEKFRSLFDQAADLIAIVDLQGNFLDLNRRYEEESLWSLEEMIGKNVLTCGIVTEESAGKISFYLSQLVQGKEIPIFEVDGVRKDGGIVPYELRATPIRKDGRIVSIQAILRNITDRKKAEKALLESHLFIEGIINSIPVRVFWKNRDLIYLGCNTIFARDAGFESPSDIVGKDDYQMVWRDQAESYRRDDRQVIESGHPKLLIEEPQTNSEGKTITLLTSKIPLYSFDGKIMGVLGTYMDITEHKKIEDALRESEAALHDSYFTQATINMILRESLENIPLEVILQKALNMILSVPWLSFEAVGSIHLAEDETGMLSMKAHYNLPKPLVASCARIPFGDCLCGKAAQTQDIGFADHIDDCHHMSYEGMHNHGHYAVPILFRGKTLGVLNICLKEGHIRDQNEEEFLLAVADTLAGIIARKKAEERHKELEAQLLLAQKMEAVGQLAGGIAHDFNNLLQSIILGIALAKHRSHEDNVKEVLTETENACLKAEELSSLLITFAKGGTPVVRKRSITDILRETVLATLRASLVETEFTIPDDLWPVAIDEGQIRLSIKQLVMNAREAMPSGGVLKVLARNLPSIAMENVPLEEGQYVKVTFADNGIGIAPENLSKIFDPYFTTKAMGSQKGMGLSLTVSQSIVKKHRGIITAESKFGEGARFHIYLPAALT